MRYAPKRKMRATNASTRSGTAARSSQTNRTRR
jgi:hypothetical protein